ncbi:N-acetylglucosamine-1-phosphodiester alpha-N-acetylglucosaminidase-like [Ylistrum balloti]|uniref:N-acetylglucosamine-1-phosphodiester alpha-N-acetylglucosaminidase-like n=1 Tax=Ylistrum balloti TaxID=509963 RepID=UPI0029058F3C|nr:N-acetylglucosamine-1-phosphodiester alpha-N-acetylglucosaminidase-like [Ylistrum balloti]
MTNRKLHEAILFISSFLSLSCTQNAQQDFHVKTADVDMMDTILETYWASHYLQRDGYDHHRNTRECQQVKYGNMTSSTVVARDFHDKDLQLPLMESRYTFEDIGPFYNRKTVFIHYTVVNNPFRTLSVLEPLKQGGCQDGKTGDRATVVKSAEQMKCMVAINAGLFNTTSGSCLGNVVSNGRLVQDSGGIQNAHFGIKANGELFFGYLSEIDLIADDFLQLVGGVIWLVRNGEVYVSDSLKIECADMQETGSLETFTNIVSARTAVGVDKEGRVLLIQVDGKSFSRGVSLEEFAHLLLTYDIVDAINLDGGGSSTYVINGTVVNFPSDKCSDDSRFHCGRKVSTILCVHDVECVPTDCSGHGQCKMGRCECDAPWIGTACDTLQCINNCSSQGSCTSDGCDCDAGWHGDDCNQSCSSGQYGKGCIHECVCLHGASCNPVDGTCDCPIGKTGAACDQACPFGYYGEHCKQLCLCQDGCPCHAVTGSCNFTDLDQDLFLAGQCYAKATIKQRQLVPDQSEDYRLMQMGFAVLGLVASISAVLNIILAYKLFTKPKQRMKYRPPQSSNSSHMFMFQGVSTSDDELSSLSEYSKAETTFTQSERLKDKNTKDLDLFSKDNT